MKPKRVLIVALSVAVMSGSARAQTSGISNVQHVVIFMQENRAFDHYFGALKGVRGFADRNALRFQNGNSVLYQPQSGGGYVLPFHNSLICLVDLDHSWDFTHAAWHSGKWDQWIPFKSSTAMAYYNRSDLAYYYALADAYTVCDAFFCSAFGSTNPNRLYLWTGMLDPNGTGGGPAIDNGEPGFTWTTYPERLQAAGISWKVYQEFDNFDDNALAWFNQFRNAAPGNPLYDRGMAMVSDLVEAFRTDVTNGTLPKVSWLIAPTTKSEHPIWPPIAGEVLTKQLLDSLALNPAVFNSTVFILTYDENDGFFDHVPPPVPPPGTPDEFVGGLPIGLAVRVPTIIISPWSRGGFVCSQVFDHTSILRFLEAWTGVLEPNISAWRRKICGDLTSALNFANPDYTFPTLPVPSSRNCTVGVIPPVPAPQSAPVQEPGTRPARPLPYQLNVNPIVDCAHGQLYLAVTNAGAAAANVAIYPNAYRADGPWNYDVDPANAVIGFFDVLLAGGGRYDLTCYGPDGFQRRFAGNVTNACDQIEVTSEIDPGAGITLALRNSTASAVNFTIFANAYTVGGPWTNTVPPGNTVSNTFLVVEDSDGWYDFTVVASSDDTFVRRLAGHVENNLTMRRLHCSVSGATLHLRWASGQSIRLQKASGLSPDVWSDVPGTLGGSSAVLPTSNSAGYFRLAQ